MGNAYQIKSSPRVSIFPLAPAHLIGMGAFQLYAALLFLDPIYAIYPLAAFVVLMLLAPVLPRWRLLMPVITKVNRRSSVVLTFDDGPDPDTTPMLLDLLKKHRARAVFFLVGKKALQYPDLAKRIIEDGHEIGNHTMDHDVFSAMKPLSGLRKSIEDCQVVLRSLGARSRLFRPAAWVVRPGLWKILLEHGMVCVNARVKPMDLGNRRIKGMAARVLKKVRTGDVIALHDTSMSNTYILPWLNEVEKIIEGLSLRGLDTKILSSATRNEDRAERGGVETIRFFYDSLACDYDSEQESTRQKALRHSELEQVYEILDQVLKPGSNVLEVGAGTGRFTLKIAQSVSEITAVDISSAMLWELEKKARGMGLENVNTIAGDVYQVCLKKSYDVICSFSAFEYFPDLQKLLTFLSQHLKPGGVVFFTTAHAGLFRFFVQTGNAMRQGIWLHARTINQTRKIMQRAGLDIKSIESFGPFKMLLAALGEKLPL